MEGIFKSLSQGESVTLCVEDAKRLNEYIKSLEERAQIGDDYRKEVEGEVLRLSALAQTGISRETMATALKGLSLAQLREFAEVYRKQAESTYLPRTAAQKKSCTDVAGNKEFRI